MVHAVGNFQAQAVGNNAEQFGNLSDLGIKVSYMELTLRAKHSIKRSRHGARPALNIVKWYFTN